jgi:hypothetical protein
MNTSGDARPARAESAAASASGHPGTPPGDERELRRDIERTRERLGVTVEQLVGKADVRAKAKAKAAELTGRVTAAARTDTVQQRGAQVASAAAVLLGSYLLLRWWTLRKSDR